MEVYIILIIVVAVMIAFALCIFCWKKSKCLGGEAYSKTKMSEKYEYSSSTGTLPSTMPLPSSLTITTVTTEQSHTKPPSGFEGTMLQQEINSNTNTRPSTTPLAQNSEYAVMPRLYACQYTTSYDKQQALPHMSLEFAYHLHACRYSTNAKLFQTTVNCGFVPNKTAPQSESQITETRSYSTSAAPPPYPNAGNSSYTLTTETSYSSNTNTGRRSPSYPAPVPEDSPAAPRYYRMINKQFSKESLYDNVGRQSPWP